MLKCAMRGLYIHIPFCLQKCHYCNFAITLDRTPQSRHRFFEALEAEIRRARIFYKPLSFETVYFGGGTPSLLKIEEMQQVMHKIQENFLLSTEAEITCEFNPGDADREKIRSFKKCGVNRVSLGVQAFQEPLIRASGRRHGITETYKTVEILREEGIDNISFDLIAGLPGQTLEDFEFSLRETIAQNASQLSLYDLEIHSNTFWGKEKERKRLNLPEEETRAGMFAAAVKEMTGAGYVQYEISTFAKPGRESRHNLIYWNNREYLGLGPGAFSYLEGKRFQWASDFSRYLDKSAREDMSRDFEEVLSPEKKEIETLITGLRLQKGVSLADYEIIRPLLETRVPQLVERRLLESEGSRIRLSSRGRFLAEQAFTLLIGQ